MKSLVILAIAVSFSVSAAELQYPRIKNHGGVAPTPSAAVVPEPGANVVLDVTTGETDEGVNGGLARAARFINLYAQAGIEDLEMTLVFHGAATDVAVRDDEANRALMRQLGEAGVELFVCGQALAHQGYEPGQLLPEVRLANSAAVVNINRQLAGYAYLPIH